MHLFTPCGPAGKTLAAEKARLEGLVDHVTRLLQGEGPGSMSEGDVPVLDRWAIARTAEPCLIGLASGHPTLPGKERPIVTSRLWLMSSDGTWARTLSRWYHLGRPAGQASSLS